MHKDKLLALSIVFACASLLSGAILAGSDNQTPSTADKEHSPAGGPLDGLSFRGAVGPDGKPKDIPDLFVFENGSFVSKECELRCEYPARPYFIRKIGNKTEFISETRCPYKDATIIWRGTVEGDTLRGKSSWIVKRWYWTVENTFEFEGKLIKETPDKAVPD